MLAQILGGVITNNYYTNAELIIKFEENKTLTCRAVDANSWATDPGINISLLPLIKMKYCKRLNIRKD